MNHSESGFLVFFPVFYPTIGQQPKDSVIQMNSLVIMGVAGSGKSVVARATAVALRKELVEGDDYHSPASRAKMRAGIALTDEDRTEWLETLGRVLVRQTEFGGVVLTCSALRRNYRDRLRQATPGLMFVWLRIDEQVALERVTRRAAEHLFPPALVASQFAALEPPTAEADVLAVNATDPLDTVLDRILSHLKEKQ
jgi:gluconokinase